MECKSDSEERSWKRWIDGVGWVREKGPLDYPRIKYIPVMQAMALSNHLFGHELSHLLLIKAFKATVANPLTNAATLLVFSGKRKRISN